MTKGTRCICRPSRVERGCHAHGPDRDEGIQAGRVQLLGAGSAWSNGLAKLIRQVCRHECPEITPIKRHRGLAMKWCVFAGVTVFAVFLILFLIGEAWQALLADPAAQLRQANPLTALVGVGLLVADAALPVPASMVMIALGAVFGAVLGTLLAAIGTIGATLVGFELGRRGGALLDRHASLRGWERADRLLKRWGVLAIVLTRPVPLLAETTAVLAGASSLGWERATIAAIAGAIPTAGIYALTGAAVTEHESTALLIGATVAIVGCTWLVDRHLARRLARSRDHELAQMATGSSS